MNIIGLNFWTMTQIDSFAGFIYVLLSDYFSIWFLVFTLNLFFTVLKKVVYKIGGVKYVR